RNPRRTADLQVMDRAYPVAAPARREIRGGAIGRGRKGLRRPAPVLSAPCSPPCTWPGAAAVQALGPATEHYPDPSQGELDDLRCALYLARQPERGTPDQRLQQAPRLPVPREHEGARRVLAGIAGRRGHRPRL